MDEFINFFGKKKDYRSLSNFYEGYIEIKGYRLYESGEHGYHGEKYFRLGNLCEDEVRKQKMIAHSKGFLKPSIYKTCNEAKKMGGKKGFGLNEEEQQKWFSIGLDVQKEICLWKYKHFEEVRNDLLKSQKKILIHPAMRVNEEKVKNKFWEGRCVVRNDKLVVLGKNMLGNIWMEIRDCGNSDIAPGTSIISGL
jgi:predicted NAD-dependent protein-ADP-ribosyltransferase YbiA (DUF1768 family)